MICLKKLTEAFFALFLVFLAFTPLDTNAKIFDKVAAKINSEIITLSSVEERSELLRKKYEQSSSKSISRQKLLREALDMIIEEKLQAQEGVKRGMVVDEASIDAAIKNISEKNGLAEGQLEEMLEREGKSLSSYRNYIRDQIMASKVSRFEMSNRVQVSDKEIAKYYRSHQKEFWADSKVRARHILFIVEPDSTETNRKIKLEQAKKALTNIRKGESFIEIASEYSEDVSASNGGDLGFVAKGQMVSEFEEALFNLKVGQVSEIVQTEYGYHIIKAEEVLAGKTLPLVDAENSIVQILSTKKREKGYKEWMNELRKSAFIEISLFAEPDINNNILSDGLEGEGSDSNITIKKKFNASAGTRKEILQKKWEEMYRSVEKSKQNSKEKEISKFKTLKEKLKYIKKLKDENTISKGEYQRRKKKLLSHL